MKTRISLDLDDEFLAAIDAAVGDRHRQGVIESWLWRIKEVKQAAAQLGVERKPRRKRGRPKKP